MQAASPPTQAPQPTQFQGWQFTDERGSCSAGTSFEGGMVVLIRYYHGDNIAYFTVTNPAWETIENGRSYPVQMQFSNGEEFTDTQAVGVRVDDATGRLTGVTLRLDANDFLPDFAGSARVSLTMDNHLLTRLNLSGTRAVIQRLITCSIASWRRYPPDPFAGRATPRLSSPTPDQGRADPQLRNIPARRSLGNLGSYFSTDDYPASALRERAQGTTVFTLTIGEDGRVARCVVIASSGSDALDQATCRILTARARYSPARDQNGNPTTGVDSGSVTWRLPAA
jgi:protein TonB